MAAKTANVTARIQPDIKESADAQFDSMMKTGLAQVVSDDSSLAKDVFEELRKRV